MELLIAVNPDPDSRLPYLLRLPIGSGLVLRTAGTWPRTNALYCYPVEADEWPTDPQIVERVALRSCVRRGAAIDVVAERSRENRSQIVTICRSASPAARAVGVRTFGRACFRVRGDCQKTASRPRAWVKSWTRTNGTATASPASR